MEINKDSCIYPPLISWFNRHHPIPRRFYRKKRIADTPDVNKWLTWLSIEESVFLHQVNELKWISLKESIENNNKYLNEASIIINGLEGGWLDGEEQLMLQEQIGNPPIPCLPIYLITCIDDVAEEVVYIGKTKCNNRFSGGHTAAIKLHAPEFENKKKKIYRCTIWFHFNDEYIILDWIHPQELALEILESIESQLIFHFKPKLNTNKMGRNYTKWNFSIHIENLIDHGFLSDTFI